MSSEPLESTARIEEIPFAETVGRSLSLKVAISGIALFVIAILINTLLARPTSVGGDVFDLWGLWAAMVAVWGSALFLVGIITFVVVWWKRQ